MKFTTVAAAVAALTSAVEAYKCQNLTVPITVSARQGQYSISAPGSNIEVTNFVLNLAQQGANYTQQVLTGVRVSPLSCDITDSSSTKLSLATTVLLPPIAPPTTARPSPCKS